MFNINKSKEVSNTYLYNIKELINSKLIDMLLTDVTQRLRIFHKLHSLL